MTQTADHRWVTDSLESLTVTGPVTFTTAPVVGGNGGKTTAAVYRASTTAASAAISNTETLVMNIPLQAGTTLAVGSRVRILLNGTSTATAANTTTLTIRIGTLGTTGDTSFGTFVTSASGTTGTNVPFHIEVDITFQTVGASPTAFGTATVVNNAATALAGAVTNVIGNTSLSGGSLATATFLDVTCLSAASTTALTFQDCSIEVLS